MFPGYIDPAFGQGHYKKAIVSAVILILAITSLVFLPSVKNDFVRWDEDGYVIDNDSIKELSLANIRRIFTSAYIGHYQPVTILTYALEYRLFMLDARYYHLTNIILHLFNCLLVFWMIMLISGRPSVSLAAVMLFAIHPMRVESVAWIAGRKDVLYGLFFLSSLISYIHYVKKSSKTAYGLCVFFFILSLLSKSMAMTLPFVLFLFDYILDRRYDKKMIFEKILLIPLSFVFGAAAFVLQKNALGNAAFTMSMSRIWGAFYAMVLYLQKTLVPIGLSAVYPYPARNNSFYAASSVSFVIIAVIAFGVFYSRRFTKKIIFGSLFALITIAPVLEMIPAGFAIIADRYTYLPSIGLFYIAAEGLSWLYRRRSRAACVVIAIAVLAFFAFLTHKRIGVWADEVTLWSDVLKKYPTAAIAYNNRGAGYQAKGQLDKAFADYDTAVRLEHYYADAYYNRGNICLERGEFDKAIIDYSRAIQINPSYAKAYCNREIAYKKQKGL